VENDWKNTIYPCVPGHEVVGRVTETGSAVTSVSKGDIVGVGCMIDSCRTCPSCKSGDEQYCQSATGPTMTYNGYLKADGSGFNTFGGYSTHIVSKEHFVIPIPATLDIASAAPILCAGVTTYTPLKANVKPGDTVAVVGIGGLGHMGVMLAKALGAQVTAITTHEEKRPEALALGADEVLVSSDKEAMAGHAAAFNFILCTIPDQFDLSPYIPLLAPKGRLVTVGLLGEYKKPLDNMQLIMAGASVGGSLIGNIADTREVLELCAEKGIKPQVELIAMKDINEAFRKIEKEDVRFRYVIDMNTLRG
jgi:alcohol dehydrogenase (NADP+)